MAPAHRLAVESSDQTGGILRLKQAKSFVTIVTMSKSQNYREAV